MNYKAMERYFKIQFKQIKDLDKLDRKYLDYLKHIDDTFESYLESLRTSRILYQRYIVRRHQIQNKQYIRAIQR